MTDQELFDRLKARIENPKWMFNGGFGMNVTKMERGHAEAEVVLEERHGNPVGSVHGGLYLTLSDDIGGTACATTGYSVTTVSSHMNFLSVPGPDTKTITAKATVIKEGHRICVVEVRTYDDSGRMLTTGMYEYMKLHPVLLQNEQF